MEEEYQMPLAMITRDRKIEFTWNSKAMNALLISLPELELVKVTYFTTPKEIWDKMRNYYEGDNKVNQVKLQGFRMKFESLKIHDDEDIAKYFLRVDEVVNTIRGPDEYLKELLVDQKVLRSLPERFNPKVSSIEDVTNLEYFTLDQLLGTLSA